MALQQYSFPAVSRLWALIPLGDYASKPTDSTSPQITLAAIVSRHGLAPCFPRQAPWREPLPPEFRSVALSPSRFFVSLLSAFEQQRIRSIPMTAEARLTSNVPLAVGERCLPQASTMFPRPLPQECRSGQRPSHERPTMGRWPFTDAHPKKIRSSSDLNRQLPGIAPVVRR
jgi:hypothetical protein